MQKRNPVLVEVREFIRHPSVFPGGYPKILVMADGETLCPACARAEYRQISNETRHNLQGGWKAGGVDIHYEGEPVICAHCGKETESAYGIPDND